MKKEIVFVTTSFARGGAEAQLIRLASRLRDRGWDLRIISMLNSAPVPGELSRRGVEVVFLGMKRGAPGPRAVLRVAALLQRWRPPILATFNFPANMLGRVAGALAGVPVIVSSIRNEHFGGMARDRMMRITGGIDSVTTTNSRLAALGLVNRNVVSSKVLRVIENGIIPEHYAGSLEQRDRIRGELGIRQDVFLWLAVGRLEPQKDYPNLFRAVESMTSQRPFMLCVAGNGPLREELLCDIRQRGLRRRVRLLGLRDDIPSLLSAGDAFVLSSAWEGLPNVIMEALAAGKPVISTRVGGAAELVEEGVSGFLVPPGAPGDLGKSMEQMMDLSADERSRMGDAGREHIEKEFGMERVVDRWEDLFVEQILNT